MILLTKNADAVLDGRLPGVELDDLDDLQELDLHLEALVLGLHRLSLHRPRLRLDLGRSLFQVKA